MTGFEQFHLDALDYVVFASYFVVVSVIGWWAGRKENGTSDDYFLAGRTLPWYVVGTSFIGSNISSEHFIGMVGAAYVFGICVAMSEWSNVWVFSLLIWFFIPFLLASKVVTIPEFLEKRFNPTLRQFFAVVTLISNVVAFLAAVLYGGGMAVSTLFGWNLWVSVTVLGVLAGSWAIYGGLKAVAWTDFFMVAVMFAGGATVTVLGLYALSGDSHSLAQGWHVMVEKNQAQFGVWKEAVAHNAQNLAKTDTYNRLSVIQPVTHITTPWPSLLVSFLSISLWYNVANQFMIQRVLGAKNMYHARMGIVLAGMMKVVLPVVIVVPGLIMFALNPDLMMLPWAEVRPAADKGYVTMLQTLVPIGLRGLFLAALFGAIQSSVTAVINSTATIFTMDIYKRLIRPSAPDRHYVKVGAWSSVVVMIVAIVLAPFIKKFGNGLFVYIHTLFAFFAPPFASVFLLGILFRRINSQGATTAVFAGFTFALALKLWTQFGHSHPAWIEPFAMQAFVTWLFCTITCVGVSLATPPPPPEKVTDILTCNWQKMNIGSDLGGVWYKSVIFWWLVFVAMVIGLVVVFSGVFL